MRSSPAMAVQTSPRRRRNAWRYVVPMAAALAMASSHAEISVPAGSTIDFGGGSSDLGCSDLIVEGTFVLGAGGSITGVRNVLIAAGGTLSLDGGNVQLSQQFTNQGTFNAGGGQVVRVDGGAGCAPVGPVGPINFAPPAPVQVPVDNPGVLALMAMLLGGLGWRMQSATRRPRGPKAK